MKEDPILIEVHGAREALFREFEFDLEALGKHLELSQAQSGHRLVSLEPRRLKPEAKTGTVSA